jgi:hypothetical protein
VSQFDCHVGANDHYKIKCKTSDKPSEAYQPGSKQNVHYFLAEFCLSYAEAAEIYVIEPECDRLQPILNAPFGAFAKGEIDY